MLTLACSLLVIGCSIGRSYHAFDSHWSLGYNDTRMGEDVWSISYRGYEISQGEANDYALLRASEVSTAAGYRFFAVVNEQNSNSASGMRDALTYPEVRLTIKAYKEKPAGNIAFLDGQYLAPAIRQKYGLGR
jgi:hypothetical protein